MHTYFCKRIHHSDKHKNIIRIFYILGLIGMIFICFLINVTKEAPQNNTNSVKYIDISNDWYLDASFKEHVEVKSLGQHMDESKGILSIFYQLPEISQDTSLVYRSKDVSTEVYIDGNKIYETSVYQSKWYNASPGNLWNVMTVNSKYSGQYVELRIKMIYDTNAITIDSLMLGDKAEIILDLFSQNLFGLLISLLLILIGFALIILDVLPSYGHLRTNHSLFWIGLFALQTGTWCMIETNMIQFVVRDMRKLQLIDNMLMITDSMPLLLYMDSEMDILKKRGMRIFAYVNTAFIFLCIIVQLTNIGDMHHMLTFNILLMIIIDISLFICVVVNFINRLKNKQPLLNEALKVLGMSSLWFLAIFEAIRSIIVDRIDRAGLIRIGMILLCLFWAASTQIQTYKLLDQGLKYDFVSKLAYLDGLTGIGNRTAYIEKLEEYENNSQEFTNSQVGIIYFDVNNLKKVNDKQGHEYGDKLIQAASEKIKSSFGQFGKTYRIGGDEFAVLFD